MTLKGFRFLCRIQINNVIYAAFVSTNRDEYGIAVDDFYLKRADTEFDLTDNQAEWVFAYLNQELQKELVKD